MLKLSRPLKKFKKGDFIFKEGDEGKCMYVIVSGKVSIIRKRSSQTTILATLKKEDFFGEMSVFTGLNRSASAIAETDCEVQPINKETFISLVGDPVVWRILQKLSDRIMEFDNRVVDLLVEDKLAKILQLFRRYVAPKIVDKILCSGKTTSLDFEGELREVTVLFADIRNFTSIAKKMSPHDAVTLLNTYLGEMTQVIFRYDGTLDKYIGDCIMAIFNAPLKQVDHAKMAVSAGIQILNKIDELKEKYKNITVGVGINTGKAVIGNIGTDLHLDYTVIGDAVNIASRLCRNAGPGELLVSENTYNLIDKNIIKAVELPAKMLKGKTKPVNIYNIINLRNERRVKNA